MLSGKRTSSAERTDSDIETQASARLPVLMKPFKPVPAAVRLQEIASLAVPAVFCNIFTRLQSTANVAFIGQTGSKEMMAGVGLGDVALAFFGQYALLGLNNAIETLAA